MNTGLPTLIRTVATARDLDTLWAVMVGYFRSAGARIVSYRHVIGEPSAEEPPQVYFHGLDRDIVDQILANPHFRDNPIIERALHTTEPFYWTEATRLSELSRDDIDYLEYVRALVPGKGLVIQVFGPDSRNGTVNLGFGDDAPELERCRLRELQLAAQLGHLRYCRLVPPDPVNGFDLTRRECEVLAWIAKGKSNSVIADILGISVHTVDTHVRRIFRKLDVNDRTTAAVKGIGAGLLQLAA
ncbi:helix-turn-helix transcriptional regulator [Tropicimonas sp.]|uniref:helix-turn-helix transcriptional regulator n=1 Tax=Tropicimonas sp. TaxID=2067044 RepID=UPI003A879CAE